jgi:anti-anti-sigma factor
MVTVVERPAGGAAGARRPVVELSGEYDLATVPMVERLLRRRFGPFFYRRHLVIDLGAVTRIDESFVDLVVLLARRLHAEGHELVLTRPSGSVRNVVAEVGLPNLVPVYETVDEALAALEAPSGPIIPPRFEARPR